MVAGAVGIGLVLRLFLDSANISLVFLTAVLASAVAYGLWPSLFASLAAVLAYNVFFLQPLYTVTIADPENVVAMFFFVIVAVIVSNLTSRVRSQAIAARQRAQTMEDLYLFARKLGGAHLARRSAPCQRRPDRPDAEAARAAAAARRQRPRPARGKPARRHISAAAEMAAATGCWRGQPARRPRRR